MLDNNQETPQSLSMSFWQHIEALRKTLMACGLVLLFACAGIACFLPEIANLLMQPLKTAISEEPQLLQGLVTTSPMGIFSVLLQVCLLGGFALAMPIMLYLATRFISPALTSKEKRLLGPFLFFALLLFIIGALFSYFWLLPTSLRIAIELNRMFGFELIWSAPHYYGLVVWMTIGIGLCFEFPLILVALMLLKLVHSKTFSAYRRHIIILILILAAFITPGGDPLSLLLLAGPLYFLFELALFIGKRLEEAE